MSTLEMEMYIQQEREDYEDEFEQRIEDREQRFEREIEEMTQAFERNLELLTEDHALVRRPKKSKRSKRHTNPGPPAEPLPTLDEPFTTLDKPLTIIERYDKVFIHGKQTKKFHAWLKHIKQYNVTESQTREFVAAYRHLTLALEVQSDPQSKKLGFFQSRSDDLDHAKVFRKTLPEIVKTDDQAHKLGDCCTEFWGWEELQLKRPDLFE